MILVIFSAKQENKKATGLEFARGCVTDLGKAKY
jgi:hypothetical protein